jgi:hypothetical protein
MASTDVSTPKCCHSCALATDDLWAPIRQSGRPDLSSRRGAPMVPRRRLFMLAAPLVVAALLPATASGTSTGGCPTGDNWQLVTIQSIGFDPSTAAGVPSLDGNADGLTCIQYLLNYPRFPNAFVFRDNTVGP